MGSKRRLRNSQKEENVAAKWRPCPLGKHWVSAHIRNRVSSKGKEYSQAVKGYCRTGSSHKDHLYRDDLIEISSHFIELTGAPQSNDLEFKGKGNQYDHLIRGWTRYWNEVLDPKDPLDPNLVKALIASESGFNPLAWNKIKGKNAAYGLMQVLTDSVQLLKNPKELKDHYLNLTEEDMKDPNFSICAGIRWLFRKKEIIESRTKKTLSWRDAVYAYKKADERLIKRFDKYYQTLLDSK